MLRSISTDDEELKLVLGTCYQTMLRALKLKRFNRASESTSSGVAQPTTAQADDGKPSAKKRKIESTTSVDSDTVGLT